jgi:hypothetical protein
LCSPAEFSGWRQSVIVQVSRPFAWVVVAHLVAQSYMTMRLVLASCFCSAPSAMLDNVDRFVPHSGLTLS